MPDAQDNPSPLPAAPAVRRPLPDARAIVAFAVPEAAPPYDDVIPGRPQPSRQENTAARGTDLSSGSPALRPAPVAGTWPSQFAQVLSETLAGSRPASQLTPWTTEQARRRISRLGPILAQQEVGGGRARSTAVRRPRVRRVIVTSPGHGVLEMTVVVDLGPRCRAVAVRLERPSSQGASQARQDTTRGHAAWLCTAVEAA